MDNHVYKDMAELQEHHWWFKARKEILGRVLHGIDLPENCEILEIGCGTGGNLSMLASLGTVYGMEMNKQAAQYAKQSSGQPVLEGALPGPIPYQQQFDLVCLLDVLEHIEDDDSALAAIKPLLKPGGRIVLTVPAYQWMFGKHDVLLHHFRRYTKRSLAERCTGNGITINKLSYFNTMLFPLAAVARIIDRLSSGKQSTGYNIPHRIVNSLLFRIFRIEKFFLKHWNLPYGCSLIMLGKIEG